MIFGIDRINAVNLTGGDTTLAPSPLTNITIAYTKLLQSSMKIFIGGKLGTTYVPGRVVKEIVVLRSSLPYVVASTVLFATLAILVLAAHLRTGKDEQFTLFSVAAALDTSGIPALFAQIKRDNTDQKGLVQGDEVDVLGNRLLALGKDGGGSVLHLD